MKMAPGVRFSVCKCDLHVSLVPGKAAGLTIQLILMLLPLLLLLVVVSDLVWGGCVLVSCWLHDCA